MPRCGKGQKAKLETTTQAKRTDSRTPKGTDLNRAVAKARRSIEEFAAAIDNTFRPRKRKKNPRNRKILKAPTTHEIPLGTLVVSNADGTVRRAAKGETPIGVVIGRSHRIRRNKPTFYASVAQDVERPVEARKAAGSHQPGAPVIDCDFKEEEKRLIHAMNYGMAPGTLEEMYGGGSRAGGEDISETIERRERGEAAEADGLGSEHAGIHRRPGWQREGSRPTWYNATGTEGGGKGRKES